MATTQDLHYRITANDAALDRLIVKTNLLGRSLIGTGNALKPLDVQLRALGRRVTEIGRYMTRSFTAPTILLGAAAVKMGYDFEKSFGRIESLVDASTKDMKAYRASILELGKTTPTSIKELSEALYFITSSGFEGAKALQILNQSNKAAVAGMGDVKTTADVVTSALNAYKGSALDAADVTDILLTTVKVGKAEPEELARSIGRVIPLAAQMGVELEEVGGALAATTLSGLSADLAVSGLRATLTTFTKGLKPTKEALLGIGLSLDEVQRGIREDGLAATMNELRRRVEDFNKKGGVSQKTYDILKKGGADSAKAQRLLEKDLGRTAATMLSKLFPNVRALTQFLILTKNEGRAAADAVSAVADAKGETDRAFRERMDQQWAKLGTALNRIRTQLTELGSQLLPIATALAEKFAKVFEVLGHLPGFAKQFLLMNVAIFAIVGPLATVIGLLIRMSSVYVLLRGKSIRAASAMIMGAESEVVAHQAVAAAAQESGVVAAAASAKTVSGAEAATAAYAAQTKMVLVLTEAQANQARIAALQQGGILFGGGTRLGAGASTRPAMFGPGGTPMMFPPGASEQMAKATTQATVLQRSLGGVSRAVGGVRTALVGAMGAMRGFMAVAWPLLAIEGAILLWTNWDKVSKKIGEAEGSLRSFTEKHVPLLADAWDMIPETLQTALKFNVSPLLLLAERSNRKRKEAVKDATDAEENALSRLTPKAQRLAKLHNLSAEEAKRLAAELNLAKTATNGLSAAAERAKTAFENTFARLGEDIEAVFEAATDAMLTKFDETTERMVANLKVTVRVMGRTFSIKAGQKTPAEREAEALEKSVRLLRLRNDLMDAGRSIIAATAMGDPTALREAQQAAAEARAGIAGEKLGSRAERERRAADLALTAGESRIRARRAQQRRELVAERDLQKRHLQDSLEDLKSQLENRRITISQFNERLRILMGEYGVTAADGGRLIGKSFAQGMEESLKSLAATIRRFTSDLGKNVLAEVRKTQQAISSLPGAAGGKVAGPPTPQQAEAQAYLRRRTLRLVNQQGMSLREAARRVSKTHPGYSIEEIEAIAYGPQSYTPAKKKRPLRNPSGRTGYASGGIVPGDGPRWIMAHGGEMVTPKGKLPKWLRDEMRRTTKLIARQYVRQSQLAARAASGRKVPVGQIYGAQVPRLQKMMVAAQKGRAVAGGEDAYLQKQAMLASSPIQAGLIKTRPGKTDILGPGGRSGRARQFSGGDVSRGGAVGTQHITINITGAGDPRKVAAAVRRELQKTRKRNARKMRGRNAGQVVGAG